jgi:hypothetical protein
MSFRTGVFAMLCSVGRDIFCSIDRVGLLMAFQVPESLQE